MRFSVPEVQAMRRTSIFSISSYLLETKKSKRNGLKWTDLVVGWGGLGSGGWMVERNFNFSDDCVQYYSSTVVL